MSKSVMAAAARTDDGPIVSPALPTRVRFSRVKRPLFDVVATAFLLVINACSAPVLLVKPEEIADAPR
jgi:hypothetical protein